MKKKINIRIHNAAIEAECTCTNYVLFDSPQCPMDKEAAVRELAKKTGFQFNNDTDIDVIVNSEDLGIEVAGKQGSNEAHFYYDGFEDHELPEAVVQHIVQSASGMEQCAAKNADSVEQQLPSLIKSLDRLAEAIERSNKLAEEKVEREGYRRIKL